MTTSMTFVVSVGDALVTVVVTPGCEEAGRLREKLAGGATLVTCECALARALLAAATDAEKDAVGAFVLLLNETAGRDQ